MAVKKKAAKPAIKPKKTGRPSKKDTIDLGVLECLASFSLTDEQLARVFGISVTTLQSYKKDELFLTALKKGKAISDSRVERSLYERATGYSCPEIDIKVIGGEIVKTEIIKHYPPDPTSMIFWLKNRKPDEWRDKREFEHTGKDGGPIQHKDLTDGELLRIIQEGRGSGASKKA